MKRILLIVIIMPLIGVVGGSFYAAFQVMPSVTNSFGIVTPTGNAIYNASEKWMGKQIQYDELVQKSTCALNTSKVLALADNAMAEKYGSAWAPGISKNVRENGGLVINLGRDKKEMIAALRAVYQGKLPVGTIVSACYSETCGPTLEHPTGARHVAIIGETKNGIVYLHHNNYYRPMAGESWKPGMVSKKYLAQGIDRQWQRSPWLALKTNAAGELVDFKVVAPAMLRILNPYNAYIKIAIPSEIVTEIAEGRGYHIAGDGRYTQVKEQTIAELVSNPVWTIKPLVHNLLLDIGSNKSLPRRTIGNLARNP